MTASSPSLVRRALLAAGLVCSVGLAQAQSTTRILVGFPAGGSVDTTARRVGNA